MYSKSHKTDTDIFEALGTGDEAAFHKLFTMYWPRLYAYGMKFVKSDETVRDIIQDSFMKLWKMRHSLKPVSVSSLLFTMVRNACLNYLKWQLSHVKVALVELNDSKSPSGGGREQLYNIDFGWPSDSETIYDELVKHIDDVLSVLPERTRQIFMMSRFEGLKNREISRQLGISETAVEKHISRALKALKSRFKSVYPLEDFFVILAWLSAGSVIF